MEVADVSAGGDSEWVDRSPKKSKEMEAAYAGLAEAEEWLRGADKNDPAEFKEGVDAIVQWHKEIARIALKGAVR